MAYKKFIGAALLAVIFLHLQIFTLAQPLSRSTPEAQGVSSKGIIAFLDAVAKSSNEMHSIIIVRHGRVIAEGWWNPYRPQLKHTLYSLSKSFAATAVGFAVSEKKLSLADKVVSFFPGKLPDTVSANLAAMTIKDLITMSTGQQPDPTWPVMNSTDWVKTFLAMPVVNKPGSVFLYNSMATYMLSAIVQKLTGQKIIDYLKPRLFTPLGIEGADWETDPAGYSVGGWGLRIKTEDIAKMGQFFLQKGKWNNKQILPASWVQDASALSIANAPAGSPQAQKDSSDWMQGYGYQFWRCRNNCYRGDGAFGQYMIVMPELDAVVAITSETKNMQDELNLVWNYLLPAMKANKAALKNNQSALLKKRLAMLTLPPPAVSDTANYMLLAGKVFAANENSRGIEQIMLTEKSKTINLTLKTSSQSWQFNFGSGKWVQGTTTMLGPSLVAAAKNHFIGLPPSQVAGSYRWANAQTLVMYLRYIDSPHTLEMRLHFTDGSLQMELHDSFAADDKVEKIGASEISN